MIVATYRPAEPTTPGLDQGITGLRVAVAGGHFAQLAEPAAFAAVERVARALGASRRVTIPEVQRARAAASVITSTEGAFNHLDDLKRRAKDFDPMTRDRFRAGALVPAAVYLKAQRFRAWFT